jgi:type I restriction enzyme S subunit
VCEIDSATTRLRKVIHATRREIDLLREYRARLAADVVTGKLDVRDAAARLPAELDPFDYDVDQDVEEAEGDLDPEMEEVEA